MAFRSCWMSTTSLEGSTLDTYWALLCHSTLYDLCIHFFSILTKIHLKMRSISISVEIGHDQVSNQAQCAWTHCLFSFLHAALPLQRLHCVRPTERSKNPAVAQVWPPSQRRRWKTHHSHWTLWSYLRTLTMTATVKQALSSGAAMHT
jgi:hypothetical protein